VLGLWDGVKRIPFAGLCGRVNQASGRPVGCVETEPVCRPERKCETDSLVDLFRPQAAASFHPTDDG
jgi:hypothetical protein